MERLKNCHVIYLVIVASCHRSADVAGYNGDHSCGREPRSDAVQLRGEEIGHDGGQGGEEGGEEHADLPHVDAHVEGVEKVIEHAGCDHQTWTNIMSLCK